MTDSKITALAALTGANLATGDVLEWSDISDTSMDASGTSKSMTADQLAQAPVLRRARVLDEAHADAGSASSAAEQTLASLVLPGGIIAAGDVLRCVFFGDRINNSGSNADYTWKFKIGTTTVANSGALTLGTGANRRAWSVTADVMFASTTAERALFKLDATTSGATSPQITVAQGGQLYGTAAEDTASNLNVILTCQMSLSNAATDVILHAGSIQLLKK